MISYIKGELTEVFDDTIVLENHGIGYQIRVPASIFSSMPPIGKTVKVYTYLHVREDALGLFGFLTRDDLNVFQLLLNVNGIGPKGALNILSTITPDNLRFAVLSNDVKTIQSAPGIGAKTAQRLIIELKDKLKLEDALENKLSAASESGVTEGSMQGRNEAIEALVALGYGNSEAIKAVSMVENMQEKDSEMILKEALKKLAFL